MEPTTSATPSFPCPQYPTPLSTPAQGLFNATVEGDTVVWTLSIAEIANVTMAHVSGCMGVSCGPY